MARPIRCHLFGRLGYATHRHRLEDANDAALILTSIALQASPLVRQFPRQTTPYLSCCLTIFPIPELSVEQVQELVLALIASTCNGTASFLHNSIMLGHMH